MDFQATRRMFEANAGGVSTPQQFASPVSVQNHNPVEIAAQTDQLHVHHRHISAKDDVSDAEQSTYSDIGDYAEDEDFYVAGVNDHIEHSPFGMPLREPTSTTVTESMENKRASYASACALEIEGQIEIDSDEQPFEDSDDDQSDTNLGLVRQHSNFSRLSAESWMSVDSAQEVDPRTLSPPPVEEQVAQTRNSSGGVRFLRPERGSPLLNSGQFAAEDRDPVTLFGLSTQVVQALETRPIHEMSVFECCALLQGGLPAYKKKSLRRFGARRAWLSADCSRLCWTSKKEGGEDYIQLQRVARLRVVEREVSVDSTEGYRLTLLFRNENLANIWARALSCLIPLQSRIRAPREVIPNDKDREDFTLSDDTFDGKPLQTYMAVNSYVVLCAEKSQRESFGHKLAFSRADGSFCSLRYVPRRMMPWLLRSREEVAVLKRLDHPNVVKYHECLLDPEHGGNYVVFEHVPRGAIMDTTKLDGAPPFTEDEARRLIRNVIQGLEYLHSLRIVHGDVRPDHILRCADGSAKVNPLGCITMDFTDVADKKALVRARLGDASSAFLPPELCWLCEGPEAPVKGYATDVWAVGVVLYFMLYGRVPFGGHDEKQIQENICHGKLRFPRSPESSRKVRGLIKSILERDPVTRIGMFDLLKHPWFADGGDTQPSDYHRVVIGPEEVNGSIQVAKVRVMSRRR